MLEAFNNAANTAYTFDRKSNLQDSFLNILIIDEYNRLRSTQLISNLLFIIVTVISSSTFTAGDSSHVLPLDTTWSATTEW